MRTASINYPSCPWSTAAGVLNYWAILVLALLLASCGGGSSNGPPEPRTGAATVGAAGGSVDGPDGVRLDVAAGALDRDTTIRISTDSSGAPEMGGMRFVTPIYAITPHGQAFATDAVVSIPFDPAQLQSSVPPVLIRAQPGGAHWTILQTQVKGNRLVAADTPGLSYYAVAECQVFEAQFPGSRGATGANCPANHYLSLGTSQGGGDYQQVQRDSVGYALPAFTISQPTTLSFGVYWSRPAGTNRVDDIETDVSPSSLAFSGVGNTFITQANDNDFSKFLDLPVDPAAVAGATRPNGTLVRVSASASYTFDGFYASCLCTKPTTWQFDTDVAFKVTFAGVQPTITQQPANQAVTDGADATFTVAANGPDLSIQWFRLADANSVATPLAGETLPSYTRHAVTLADDGSFYFARVATSSGSPAVPAHVDSSAAKLMVTMAQVLPSFTLQPQSMSVVEGETASFSSAAGGRPLPSVTWWRRGSPFDSQICGTTAPPANGAATSATCTTGPTTMSDSGTTFYARAMNSAGGVNSNEVILTVDPRPVAPTITSVGELSDRVVRAGGSTGWTINATGTAPILYVWGFNTSGTITKPWQCPGNSSEAANGSISGNTLSLSAIPLSCDGLQIKISVENSVGAANPPARIATLHVTPADDAPKITTGLSDKSAVENTQVSFTVAATGYPALHYAWTFGGAPVCGDSNSCAFAPLLGDSGKSVRVVVTNGIAPDAQSSAVLTVTTTDVPAVITQQPHDVTVNQPAAATFSVAGSGTPAPSYQWEVSIDGGATWSTIAGATSASYTTPATAVAQSGWQFRAALSNTTRAPTGTQNNTAVSNAVTLTVLAPLPPGQLSANGYANSPVVAVSANGTAVAVWQQGDVPMPGSPKQIDVTIYAAQMAASGVWSSPIAISPAFRPRWPLAGGNTVSPGNDIQGEAQPSVAIDGLGNAIAIWREPSDLQLPGTIPPSDPRGFRVAVAHMAPSGTWSARQLIDQLHSSYSAINFEITRPRVVMNDGGQALASWQIYDHINAAGSHHSVFAARYAILAGALTPTWQPEANLGDSLFQNPFSLRSSAMASDGRAVVTWYSGATGLSAVIAYMGADGTWEPTVGLPVASPTAPFAGADAVGATGTLTVAAQYNSPSPAGTLIYSRAATGGWVEQRLLPPLAPSLTATGSDLSISPNGSALTYECGGFATSRDTSGNWSRSSFMGMCSQPAVGLTDSGLAYLVLDRTTMSIRQAGIWSAVGALDGSARDINVYGIVGNVNGGGSLFFLSRSLGVGNNGTAVLVYLKGNNVYAKRSVNGAAFQ
jgi:hypothetical protein